MNDNKEQFRCPRCSGYIPNNIDIGAYCGAISRLDNTTEICSDCGSEEAIENYLNGSIRDWRLTSTRYF